MYSKRQKGFTIIELVVVIAIIAILSSIVLINVGSFINEAKDTTAKADLNTMMIVAKTYYAVNGGSYGVNSTTGFLTDPSYTNVANALSSMGYNGAGYSFGAGCDSAGGSCIISSKNFCAWIVEKVSPNNYYCVDSSGSVKEGYWCDLDGTHAVCVISPL